MFEEYKIKLLEFYNHQKEAHQLPGNLENLRRSNLRKACLYVFLKKNTNKDHEIIKAFFDPKSEFSDLIKSIEKVELDKFRPLVSFLQGEKNIREEASVKLIAWLIDFDSFQDWTSKKMGAQPLGSSDNRTEVKQPVDTSGTGVLIDEKIVEPDGGSVPGGQTPVDTDEKGSLGKDLPNGGKVPIESSLSQKILKIIIGQPLSIKKVTISCVTLVLLGTGVYFLIEKITTDTIRQPLTEEKCMYWTGNHYEPVKCDEKIKDATVIPLNLQSLNNLKKINLTDTLTSYSLGKVWYSKIDGRREFFTDSGMHPVDTSKRLKPLSKYILSNYVSYYRYLLTYLTWSICMVITVALFIIGVICFLKWQKRVK